LPERGLLGSEERILARVPAEEVRRARVRGVVFPAGPHFVEEKRAGLVGAAVQIVLQASFLPSRRADKSTQFRFQKELLALLCAQQDDEG